MTYSELSGLLKAISDLKVILKSDMSDKEKIREIRKLVMELKKVKVN